MWRLRHIGRRWAACPDDHRGCVVAANNFSDAVAQRLRAAHVAAFGCIQMQKSRRVTAAFSI